MKRFAVQTLLVAAAVIAFACGVAQAQVDVNVSIGGFYDELAPYGRWVDCSYGQCWVPARVAADWQPYSNGQWIYTEYGWTWVSNDPWGGSPYHYGTWASIQGYGWSWVPGTVWAPAWVTWSYSNSYVGWAPLPPTVVFGTSGYIGRPIVVSQTQYVFVPTNRFVGRNVTTVRLPAQQSAEIFRQTKAVTGFVVTGGIVRNTALPMETIERANGGKIETRGIQTAGTAPHPVAAGTAHLAVVAPAREVKAAVSARPQAAAARAPEPSREEQHAKAPAQSAKVRKAPDAPPMEAHGQTAEPPAREGKAPTASRPKAVPPSPESAPEAKHTKAPANREAQNAKARKASEAPPAEAHRQAAEPSAEHRQEPPRQAEASRPAEHAPKPKPKPQPAKEKPVEKEKHPEGDKP